MNWLKRTENMLQVLNRISAEQLFFPKAYLAGGTAVYLYLKHRISIDLDFFCPHSFRSTAILNLLRTHFKPVELIIFEEETLIVTVTENDVKVSLFHYPYALLEPLRHTSASPETDIASIRDIQAMKAVAIAQRGSVKDFIDLFYLLNQTGDPVEVLIESVTRKYDLGNTYGYHVKTALVYFDDAEPEIGDILMINSQNKAEHVSPEQWDSIKRFFREYIHAA